MLPSMRLATVTLIALIGLSLETPAGDSAFKPDPLTVERYESAYRYPQDGWIVLHIEGEPYARGYQHGRLMAPEIAAFVKTYATMQSSKSPSDGWHLTRTLANAQFLRTFEPEYLEELKGIADGAAAAGAKFEGRSLDIVDIVAINCWPEIMTLDSALDALPTGLEGKRFPNSQPKKMPVPSGDHCSAFAATGPATKDGKIVFGHITMFGLYPSQHFNVWIDVKPTKGHRVLMQSYPGGIQSGMDYYLNSAGLLVTETTIAQTLYNPAGRSIANRIRKALQYADSIDKAVEIIAKDNNGLYTNEWLLADIKTNEIAMFELGTHKSHLYRSSKNEWFGGTEGFYWGCNNTKDRAVRLETIASVNDRPANMVWQPSDRDKTWLSLYRQNKGKIDADFGKLAFTTAPLAAYHSVDAKYTTSAMAKDLQTHALFGPPREWTWEPTQDEKQRFADIQPLVSNPWTILRSDAPTAEVDARLKATDLGMPTLPQPHDSEHYHAGNPDPAWRGTIFPKSNNDVWLATAFAEYERLVARSLAADNANISSESRTKFKESLRLDLASYRSMAITAAYETGDQSLSSIKADDSGNWSRLAMGKGVMLLHDLRSRIGAAKFDDLMDEFGRANAGQEVSGTAFTKFVGERAGDEAGKWLTEWLGKPGLPVIAVESAKVEKQTAGGSFIIRGSVKCTNGSPPHRLAVGVETATDHVTGDVKWSGAVGSFEVSTKQKPVRMTVERSGAAIANGSPYSVVSYRENIKNTLIVVGTIHDAAANRHAANKLQKLLIASGPNHQVPIVEDRAITDEQMAKNHLLLIGRPDTNSVTAQLAKTGLLPITFGPRSFSISRATYAHVNSAVVVSVPNPKASSRSAVVLSGNSAAATVRLCEQFTGIGRNGADVVILANGKPMKHLQAPAKELSRELE